MNERVIPELGIEVSELLMILLISEVARGRAENGEPIQPAWPVYFSCNGKAEIWVSHPPFGKTPSSARAPLQGTSDALDEIVNLLLAVRPEGGRFYVEERGVFLAADGEPVLRFATD